MTPDERRTADTSSTPTFLGLDARGGLWAQLGGVGNAGDGIIIGVIDTGIWPESLSFSDRTGTNGNATKDGKLAYRQIPGWHGKCTPGELFNASMCNQKLIGAQWFNAGYGGNAGIDKDCPWEFNSARDYNGHGTHTASTAGGNNDVPATGPASIFGAISGMAPRARIAMYKALWSTGAGSGQRLHRRPRGRDRPGRRRRRGRHQLLDQRHRDQLPRPGRDLVPVSPRRRDLRGRVGGQRWPDDFDGRPSRPVDHHGRGRHAQPSRNGLRDLGNGTTYNGASVATHGRPRAARSTATAAAAGRCRPDERCAPLLLGRRQRRDSGARPGEGRRQDRRLRSRRQRPRQQEPRGQGGRRRRDDPGQPEPNSLNADFHFVPTVHLQQHDRAGRQGVRGDRRARRATINKATIVYNAPAPFTASFSSRGPLPAGGGTCSSRTSSLPARTSSPRSRRQATAAATSTSTAARRCRARTWPASRRC